jgi:hypothetical protein
MKVIPPNGLVIETLQGTLHFDHLGHLIGFSITKDEVAPKFDSYRHVKYEINFDTYQALEKELAAIKEKLRWKKWPEEKPPRRRNCSRVLCIIRGHTGGLDKYLCRYIDAEPSAEPGIWVLDSMDVTDRVIEWREIE